MGAPSAGSFAGSGNRVSGPILAPCPPVQSSKATAASEDTMAAVAAPITIEAVPDERGLLPDRPGASDG